MIKESRVPAGWILFFSLLISFFTLIIYMSENGFSDKELFFLLAILRYSSFTVCVSSLFFFITGIVSLVKEPDFVSVIIVIFSVIGVFYGAGIVLIDAFISIVSRGQT